MSDQGVVPCNRSHQAFDVTCMLSLLTETEGIRSCLYSAGHVTLQSMLGYTPLSGDRILDNGVFPKCFQKYLFIVKGLKPATSVTSLVREQDATAVLVRHM